LKPVSSSVAGALKSDGAASVVRQMVYATRGGRYRPMYL
jgi:hypothetical protein